MPKPSGSIHLILDLKFLRFSKFCMEFTRSVIAYLEQGEYIQDAFLNVPMLLSLVADVKRPQDNSDALGFWLDDQLLKICCPFTWNLILDTSKAKVFIPEKKLLMFWN